MEWGVASTPTEAKPRRGGLPLAAWFTAMHGAQRLIHKLSRVQQRIEVRRSGEAAFEFLALPQFAGRHARGEIKVLRAKDLRLREEDRRIRAEHRRL